MTDRVRTACRSNALWITLLIAVAACSPTKRDFGFAIESLEVRRAGPGVDIVIHQQVSLSSDAHEALRHGVPLVIEVEARLRASGARTDAARLLQRFEIRYLPLSDHFQLITGDGAPVRTYPRLRHVLADLAVVQLRIPLDAPAAGHWEARARSVLSTSELPPPMRLPARLSANWRHDSGWRTQPVVLAERA